MTKNNLKNDIERLKEIHKELSENYDDDEWDLCEFHKEELYRITDIEEHDWDTICLDSIDARGQLNRFGEFLEPGTAVLIVYLR